MNPRCRPSRPVRLLRWLISSGSLIFGYAAAAAPTLYTIGDSTVQTYSSTYYPRAGWGQVLPRFFDPAKLAVVNKAVGGTSSKTFIENGHWANLAPLLKPGDFVTIQFGINDSAGDARHTDPATTFKDYLTFYVNAVRGAGAHPILVTTQNRNSWNATSPPTVFLTYAAYAAATREVAAALDVPLIDLEQRSKELMETVGKTYATYFFFHHYPPGEWPNFPNGAADDVHFQETGAIELAKLVIAGLRALEGRAEIAPLIPALRPTYPVVFNASNPAAGLVTRSGEFPATLTVTAYAWPKTGYAFEEWTGAISGTRRHVTFTMGTAARTITANFSGSGSPTTATLLPAETAGLDGGAYKATNHGKYHGSGFVDFPTSGGSLEFEGVDGGAGGSSAIEIRYAFATGSRTGVLTVNGASQPITFAATGSFSVWQTQTVGVVLQPGVFNTVRFASNGSDLANIDEIVVITPNAAGDPPPDDPPPDDPDDPPPTGGEISQTRQAEEAAYGGGVKKENHYSGYRGSGFLNLPTSGGYVRFDAIDGGVGGTGVLEIRHALQSGSRTGTLVVNGVAQPITFSATGSFAKWAILSVEVPLQSGAGNIIRLGSSGQDLSNIDEIVVRAAAAESPGEPPPGEVVTLQAEDVSYGGGVKKESHYSGYHGSGFLNLPPTGGFVDFAGIDGQTGGEHMLDVRYALQSGSRTGVLIVNGVSEPITFAATGSFAKWAVKSVPISLQDGAANSIRLESAGQDFPNVDEIIVR